MHFTFNLFKATKSIGYLIQSSPCLGDFKAATRGRRGGFGGVAGWREGRGGSRGGRGGFRGGRGGGRGGSNYGNVYGDREKAAEDRSANPRKRQHGSCYNCHSDRHQIKDCPTMAKRK